MQKELEIQASDIDKVENELDAITSTIKGRYPGYLPSAYERRISDLENQFILLSKDHKRLGRQVQSLLDTLNKGYGIRGKEQKDLKSQIDVLEKQVSALLRIVLYIDQSITISNGKIASQEEWWNNLDINLRNTLKRNITQNKTPLKNEMLFDTIFSVTAIGLSMTQAPINRKATGSIIDFSGLSLLTQLEELDISGNSLEDPLLSFLIPLRRLRKLHIDEMGVESLLALQRMNSMEELFCKGNQLRQLDGIEKMIKLEILYCDKNPIKDINALKRFYANGGKLRQLIISTSKLRKEDITYLRSKFKKAEGCSERPDEICILQN